MSTIRAIYENGVFRPTEPVQLPERCEVEFEPRVLGPGQRRASLDEIYEILSKRYNSGESDVAERHNEHQP
jgi:predicted DNA-binding antitoxin AbrB/MazE fold protein